jgi:hypothetical protein
VGEEAGSGGHENSPCGNQKIIAIVCLTNGREDR